MTDPPGSNSSSRSQSESPSPDFIPGLMDNSRPSSSRSESVESKEDRTEKGNTPIPYLHNSV